MAKVSIDHLKVKARIGIEPRERRSPQTVILDISFEYDGRPAAQADDIALAVDYKAMADRITALLERSRYNLLEKMAQEVLELVTADRRVKAAAVTVTKPQAVRKAAGVSLTIKTP